ncbi:MAG: universal stress protein [Anaerolineae bacterium]|nr:universal stress protein [Anaerolineae bacterium]
MRLLLCTDGSAHGQEALRFGALLARASSEPATLLAVVEQATERPAVERALEEGRRWLAGAPSPEVKIRVGHPAEQILEEARSADYDLVVVGARGRRGLTRFLLGSTAERIVRHAALPVLVFRGPRRELDKMLLCTGGQARGLAVIEFGGRLARLAGAQATVLHVMSQLPASPVAEDQPTVLDSMSRLPAMPSGLAGHLDDLEFSAEDLIADKTPEGKHLQQALGILAELGVSARALVRHGLVVDEVADEACGTDYDLIAVGAHGAKGWMRLLLDDVTQEIMHSCLDRPILVVKA